LLSVNVAGEGVEQVDARALHELHAVVRRRVLGHDEEQDFDQTLVVKDLNGKVI
jgi:hypothetical protein